MLVENLGIWPSTVEIGEQEKELGREEGWNIEMRAMDRGEWREKMDKKI